MISLRGDKSCRYTQDVRHTLDRSSLTAGDEKELALWRNHPLQSPNGDLFHYTIYFKGPFIKVFYELLPHLELSGRETILELGGGNGWASTIVKRYYPQCYVVASDLCLEAIQLASQYEEWLNAKLDEKWAVNCRDLPFEGEQFDRIFTVAAFHHFSENGDFSPVLTEALRVLKSGGKMILLFEPATPRWVYPLARWRVRRKRPEAEEDILILSRLADWAKHYKCQFSYRYLPVYFERQGLMEILYYHALNRARFLHKFLPCSVNITFTKESGAISATQPLTSSMVK